MQDIGFTYFQYMITVHRCMQGQDRNITTSVTKRRQITRKDAKCDVLQLEC